jgi:tRNA modification GTPase
VQAILGAVPIVEVSAIKSDGLRDLSTAIGDVVFGVDRDGRDDEVVIFRVRHRDAARKAITDLSRAEEALACGSPLELVASDLAAAAGALSDITGEMTPEDVLDRVFADFCLGK